MYGESVMQHPMFEYATCACGKHVVQWQLGSESKRKCGSVGDTYIP